MTDLTIVIPARNESSTIAEVVRELRAKFPEAGLLVVNDGSTDETAELARRAGATVLTHPQSMGNGAAVKTGLAHATTKLVACLDADGQHRPEDLQKLLDRHKEGYAMVVGARSRHGQASFGRLLANTIYSRLASYMSGHRVDDLTSGFRVADRKKLAQFASLYPNGFSYPTTSTMAFLRAGYPVAFEPIEVRRRPGKDKSHIRAGRDGIKFLLVIFRIATLYSPLKIFVPASGFTAIAGMSLYLYTYLSTGRFTNMSALLLSTSLLIFLMGLISEQITSLIYLNADRRREQDAPSD